MELERQESRGTGVPAELVEMEMGPRGRAAPKELEEMGTESRGKDVPAELVKVETGWAAATEREEMGTDQSRGMCVATELVRKEMETETQGWSVATAMVQVTRWWTRTTTSGGECSAGSCHGEGRNARRTRQRRSISVEGRNSQGS